MPTLTLKFEADGLWPDLAGKADKGKLIHLANEAVITIAVLDGGTTKGQPSIAMRFELPDGRTLLAETTARLFVTAGQAIAGRYPHLFNDQD